MENVLNKNLFPGIASLAKQGNIYFDSAATAQMPSAVAEKLYIASKRQNFPASRAIYHEAAQATTAVDNVRTKILQFLNAGDGFDVVFCASATDAINLVAAGINPLVLPTHKKIITSSAEHHSNFVPWLEKSHQSHFIFDIVEFPERGFFVATDFEKHLDNTACILALSMDSNVVGPLWQSGFAELQKVITCAHKKGCLVLLDASQAIAHHPIDMESLDADFLVFSGHKFGGPHGVGVLVGKKHLLNKLTPLRLGGGNVTKANTQRYELVSGPARFEAGSLPVPQIIALGTAVDFLENQLLPAHKQLPTLCKELITHLQQIPGIKILGNADFISQNGHMVTFAHEQIPAHDLAWSLGKEGFLVRSGFLCAEPLFEQFKINGGVRVSLFAYNNMAQIKAFAVTLKDVIAFFMEQLR